MLFGILLSYNVLKCLVKCIFSCYCLRGSSSREPYKTLSHFKLKLGHFQLSWLLHEKLIGPFYERGTVVVVVLFLKIYLLAELDNWRFELFIHCDIREHQETYEFLCGLAI